LATVRIYKVAELLGLSSQDAMALLKSETGIDVKSASSSIEEIVARQFVERQARKRQIKLPTGPMFAETPVAKRPAAKPGKTPEPPKPVGPMLRPRLVKTHRPIEGHEGLPVETGSDAVVEEPAPLPVEEVVALPQAAEQAPPPPDPAEPIVEDTA
jgi:hypothetical protein